MSLVIIYPHQVLSRLLGVLPRPGALYGLSINVDLKDRNTNALTGLAVVTESNPAIKG